MASKKRRRAINSYLDNKSQSHLSSDSYEERYYNEEIFDVTNNTFKGKYNISNGSVNVTGNSLILKGLPHFTEYQIMVKLLYLKFLFYIFLILYVFIISFKFLFFKDI